MPPLLNDEHRVKLDAFEGPLDLLLYLIRRSEVDIHDIPIASITEQYLAHLEELQGGGGSSRIDIDLAGEFLVMAATLMEIKSRLLNPKPIELGEVEAKPGEREDPRAELVRQLLAFKRFRDAADALERRAEDWSRRFPAAAAVADDESLQQALEALANEETDLDDVNLIDLVESFKKIAETVNFERLGEHQVTYDDTPVELHAEDIVDRLRRHALGERLDEEMEGAELEFKSLFRGRTRAETIGLFLALLQLVRQQRVTFRSESEHLWLRLKEQDDAGAGGDAAAS